MWKSYKEASCCVRSPLALFTANGNSLLYGVTRASWKLLPFNDAIIYNLQSTLRSPPTLPHVCVCVCECVSILRFPPPSSIIHEAFFCTIAQNEGGNLKNDLLLSESSNETRVGTDVFSIESPCFTISLRTVSISLVPMAALAGKRKAPWNMLFF